MHTFRTQVGLCSARLNLASCVKIRLKKTRVVRLGMVGGERRPRNLRHKIDSSDADDMKMSIPLMLTT
jgi:hypothetical protein